MDFIREKCFKRECEELAMFIGFTANVPILNIHYKEYLNNVCYNHGRCYCTDFSERRFYTSEIEKMRYKNRIQVIMIAGDELTKQQKQVIQKVLRTNVKFRKTDYLLNKDYTEIVFNVNPHKM